MAKEIEYFYALVSPWTYLGHQRLVEIAARYDARINFKPINIMEVFNATGGLPLKQRHEFRRKYRMGDLMRWKRQLNSDIVLEPKFFPADDRQACKVVIAAGLLGHELEPLTLWYHQVVWVNEQNITDESVLHAGLEACGLPVDEIMALAKSPEADDRFAANTREALDHSMFGAPWYVIDGECFWGQDRLDFVEEKLASNTDGG